MEAPIVLSNEQEIRFAGNGGDRAGTVITPENSTIAPVKVRIYSMCLQRDYRPGLVLAICSSWSDILPLVRKGRTAWHLTLEVGYRAPTGDAMKPGSKAWGVGFTNSFCQLDCRTASHTSSLMFVSDTRSRLPQKAPCSGIMATKRHMALPVTTCALTLVPNSFPTLTKKTAQSSM